jgi:hypothetical protein
MTLSSTVQPAASIIVSFPGNFSWRTRTAKTMVAEPADEELLRGARPGADQAEKDRKHPTHVQAEHCIEQRRPSDAVDHAGDNDTPEHHPCQQRQRLARVLGGAQQFRFVSLAEPAQQKPADKACDEPAAPHRLRRGKARRR